MKFSMNCFDFLLGTKKTDDADKSEFSVPSGICEVNSGYAEFVYHASVD